MTRLHHLIRGDCLNVDIQQEIIRSFASPISVLVVEDETLIRLLACDSLRDDGFDVETAASAADAIAVLESGSRVDIVFTDVMMPGTMNGIGLANWIRIHRPGLPIALTSGTSRSRLSEMGLRDEETYFAKPVDFGRLIAHIRAVVAATRPVAASSQAD